MAPAHRACEHARVSRTHAGNYKLEARVAQGGMGEVWRARHPILDRDVAVKLLRGDLGGREEMRDSFLREVQVLSRLRSPQTVQVLDAGVTEDGLPFLVTEFLLGEDLRQRIDRVGAIPWTEAVPFALDVLRSLAEAHAIGLVHRDIKPANVFIQNLPGGQIAVKVLDFGVAKILSQAEGVEETLVGFGIKGSPRYMAPEQIRGVDVSARTDLYAVGGLLYQMLSGTAVFEGATRDDLLSAHLHDVPISLAERCPLYAVPEALDALILRCLSKSPAERPASAEALIRSLQALMGVPDADALNGLGAVVSQQTLEIPSPFSFDEAPATSPNAANEEAPANWLESRGDALAAVNSPSTLELDESRRRHARATAPTEPPRTAREKAPSVAPDAVGSELELASDPRTVAEAQRRSFAFEAQRVRRRQARASADGTWRTVLLLVGIAAAGGLVFWLTRAPERHVPAPPVGLPQPEAPVSRVRPPVAATLPTRIEDIPAFAKRTIGTPTTADRLPSATLAVQSGTATFQRVDTGERICVDAVECPVPIEVAVRVFRPGGASTLVPGVSMERAKLGPVDVELR